MISVNLHQIYAPECLLMEPRGSGSRRPAEVRGLPRGLDLGPGDGEAPRHAGHRLLLLHVQVQVRRVREQCRAPRHDPARAADLAQCGLPFQELPAPRDGRQERGGLPS